MYSFCGMIWLKNSLANQWYWNLDETKEKPFNLVLFLIEIMYLLFRSLTFQPWLAVNCSSFFYYEIWLKISQIIHSICTFFTTLQGWCITMYCGKMIILMTGDDKIPLHIQDSLVCENGSNWHQIVEIEKTWYA